MVLVIIGQGARSLTGQGVISRTPFDGPLWLFLASAVIGLVIAYDWTAAWSSFWLIFGGFIVYNTLATLPDQVDLNDQKRLPILQITLIALPTGIALLALLTNDWGSFLAQIRWHTPMQTVIQRLNWPGPTIHLNAIAGVIATFLPLQVVAWRERPFIRSNTWIAQLAVGFSVAALLISGSLGAWLALVAVLGGQTVWRAGERWLGRLRQKQIAIRSIALTTGLLISFLILSNTQLLKLREDRLIVWRNSLDLASDYPLTGVGLASFRMAYSSYTFLVHVGHTSHAHNLLLDIWLKHGALGLLALGWLMFRVTRLAPSESPWRPASLNSLGVLLLHGLVDDAFYGYAPQMSLWLFVPLAILTRTVKVIEPIELVGKANRGWPLLPTLGGFILMILVLIFTLVPNARAILHANWGAILQTRTELAAYRWPRWTIQDELRRSPHINLEPAIVHYQTALALDRSNPTANRRLGQIELSRGEYEAARRHLIAAYTAAPWQRATRQLLGEVYAITGEIEQAASLWSTIDVNRGQLELRRKWYLRVGEHERADRIARAATLAEVRSQ